MKIENCPAQMLTSTKIGWEILKLENVVGRGCANILSKQIAEFCSGHIIRENCDQGISRYKINEMLWGDR